VGRWNCILICARVYVCVCVVCVLRESVLRVVWCVFEQELAILSNV
jgi:hypothetical protein